MSFYRDILTKAWVLTKTNRFLWLLGLFAALIAGNGGEIEIYFRNLSSLTEQTSFLSPSFWLNGTLARILEAQTELNWPLLVIGIVFLVAVIWLVITSQIGIIHSAGLAFNKEKLSLKKVVKQSQNFLWSVFCLNLLSKIVVYVGLLVFALPWLAAYIKTEELVWMILYLITSFLILVPLAIVVSFLVKYAAGYIILRQKRLVPALGLAWRLFLKNWLISIEMAFVVFVLNLLVSFSTLILVFIFTSPYLLTSTITGLVGYSFTGITLFIVLGYLLLLVAVVFIGSIFSAFQWSAWTLLFVELSEGRGGKAKVVRWFSKK